MIDSRNKTAVAFISIAATLVALMGARAIPARNLTRSVEISETIVDQLHDRLNLNRGHYEITVRRSPFLAEEFDGAGDFDSLVVTPLSSGRPRGLFPLLVEVHRGERVIRHGQVSVYVATFDSALVARSFSSKGTAAVKLELATEFIETTKLLDCPIADRAKLTGLRLRRNLRRGAPLTNSALERIPDIDFGDEVVIKFVNGPLVLTASGSSLQRGSAGETVKVRNLASRKIIKAIVTGPGMVHVTTPGG